MKKYKNQNFSELMQMTPATYSASLAVNEKYVEMLAPLDLAGLEELVELSCYAKHTGEGEAFLIAVDGAARYDCENHEWFKARYENFIYIDRIAIGDAYQRKGLGKIFYEDLISFASKRGCKNLCAEVNVKPDNPASHGFHLTMGFEPVGEGQDGHKIVRYYVKSI